MTEQKTSPEARPAVFVDRDGTVCREVNYLRRVEDLQLIPGAADALRLVREAGYRVVIISNQSGVARGYLTEEMVHRIHGALIGMLTARGAGVDGVYFCPHHVEGNPPYNMDCPCRKPNPGMLHKAEKELGIDLARSVVIGDKYSDVETAHRVGIPGILVLTGYGTKERERILREGLPSPDHIAPDLLAAVRWWLKQHPGTQLTPELPG